MRRIGAICCLVGTLLTGQHALAGVVTEAIIEEVTLTRSAECHRIAIRLYRPFMVIGQLPLTATRYFYVFGRALPGGEWAPARSRTRFFRERASLPRSRPEWLLAVVYVGDVPGLQALLIETDSPRPFRLVPQRDPRKVIVESPVTAGASACLQEEESQGNT